jgi:thiol-disulfide isomerase/thioredoxin
MNHLFLTVLLTMVSAVGLLAQSAPATGGAAYTINGQIRGVSDTTCVLAHYYGTTQYIPKDTARTDREGRLTLTGTKPLPEGLYLLVTPKNGYIEFLIDSDQNFSFATDTGSVVKSMKITGSKENELFYGYQQSLNKLYEEASVLNKQKKAGDAAANADVDKKMALLQKQAQTERDQFFTTNKDAFAVKVIKAASEPEVPTAPKASNGRPDSVWVFNYYKKHFWDDYDFSDERFVRTNILQRKLDRYIKELTVQNADSLIKEADYVVGKAQAGKNKDVTSYVIYYITSQYERPKILGTDGLFVHMFEKYYKTGVISVSDSSTLKSIGERVATLKPLLVGKTLPAPVVSDTLKRPINFQNIRADYTVVYFYDPHCGHCRESAPGLKKFTDANKGKGVEVVAIAIEQTPEEWKKFIREFKLGNAINGYDYKHQTDFRTRFDVWQTPTVYVLDKQKKIIARRLPPEQLEDFVQFHRKQQIATAKAPVAKASAKK